MMFVGRWHTCNCQYRWLFSHLFDVLIYSEQLQFLKFSIFTFPSNHETQIKFYLTDIIRINFTRQTQIEMSHHDFAIIFHCFMGFSSLRGFSEKLSYFKLGKVPITSGSDSTPILVDCYSMNEYYLLSCSR